MSNSTFQFDPESPLTRVSPETRRANDALRDYWNMGSGRSMSKLLGKYREVHGEGKAKNIAPPTIHWTTLENWSSRFRWQDRINLAKKLQDEADERAYEQARRDVRLGAIDDYTKLRDLANEILDKGPDFLKTTTRQVQGQWERIEGKDGKIYHVQLSPDREIVTVALDGRLALQAIKLATKICREAALLEEPKGMQIDNVPGGATVTITLPDNQRDDRQEED